MITRNLHNDIIRHIAGTDTYYISRSGTEVAIGGAHGMFAYCNALTTGLVSYPSFQRTLRIGTGTTAPSYDDYELEQFLDIDPKNIMYARSGSYQDNYDIVTAIFVNETDANWIVTEVGEYVSMDNTDPTNALLLAREVFDPVTVKPGQTFSVSMKLF